MASGEKRGQLSSGLLIAKGGEPPAVTRGPLKLASDAETFAADEAAKPQSGDGALLYSKGDASASTFRPTYWSYDRNPDGNSGGATVTPISAALVGKVSVEPGRAPRAVTLRRRRSYRPAAIGILTFVGAALVASAAFVLLWQQQASVATPVAVAPTTSAQASPPPVEMPLVPPASAALPRTAAPPVESRPQPPAVAAPPAPPAPHPEAATETPSPAVPPVATNPSPEPAPATAASAAPQHTEAAIASAEGAAQDVRELMARGDELRATGDFAAARLFYERAAEQGSAVAARAVGETYDPSLLAEAHAMGARGDADAAARWYRQAIAGGDTQAAVRLHSLTATKAAN